MRGVVSIFLPYREPINDRRSRDPASRDFLAIRETRILSEAAIMATNEEKRVGKFHPRCGAKVELSNENRVACGKGVASCFAFSNDQIPIGLQFSVKILQQTSIGFRFGITTKSPDTGPLPQTWDEIYRSDQYWYIFSESGNSTAWHKEQKGALQCVLDATAGHTFGFRVSETGELHLYHNGRDVGVALKGLPTDKRLWGFVELSSGWKVEANYMIPKASEVPTSPCAPPDSCDPVDSVPPSTQLKKERVEPPPVKPLLPLLLQTMTAEQVLEDFHDRFITDVDASNVVFEFERKGVIPEGLLTAVNRETSATLQNQILYKHLAKTSTKDSLMIVCDVIIAVQGNPRMRAMGEDMKGKLQGGAPPPGSTH